MREIKAKKVLSEVNNVYETIGREFSDSRNYFGDEFKLLLPYLNKDSFVVDVGCGNGRLSEFLNKNGYPNYLGVDNCDNFLSIAGQRNPKKKFIRGTFFDLPLHDHEVDLVAYIRSFHHIPSRKMRLLALKEAGRILKNDGVIFISVWNLLMLKNFSLLATSLLKSTLTLGYYSPRDLFIKWGKKHKRYYYAFKIKELKNLLTLSGFSIIKTVVGKDIIVIAKNGRQNKNS